MDTLMFDWETPALIGQDSCLRSDWLKRKWRVSTSAGNSLHILWPPTVSIPPVPLAKRAVKQFMQVVSKALLLVTLWYLASFWQQYTFINVDIYCKPQKKVIFHGLP